MICEDISFIVWYLCCCDARGRWSWRSHVLLLLPRDLIKNTKKEEMPFHTGWSLLCHLCRFRRPRRCCVEVPNLLWRCIDLITRLCLPGQACLSSVGPTHKLPRNNLVKRHNKKENTHYLRPAGYVITHLLS